MTNAMTVDQIYEQIQHLPEDQRQALVDRVLLLCGPPLPPYTQEEYQTMLDRRSAELDADPSIAIPLDETHAKIMKMLRSHEASTAPRG
jgi:hypothetical protein